MKFDYAIGNPAYQDETIGDNKEFAPPIYHKFLDAAFEVADKVEMIHPARFLFNAGRTPKAWNQKMLNDEHLKVNYYEPNSSKLFKETDIMGGIAITYHDKGKEFTPIGVFTPYEELNSIKEKAAPEDEEKSLAWIITVQNKFDLDMLYSDYPEFKNIIGSEGRDKRFRNNIFETIPVFVENKQNNDDVKILGISNNKRAWRYIPKKYVELNHNNLNKWKVLLPRANGSGALGQVIPTPLIGEPLIVGPNEGYTQSFIAIGAFDKENDATYALKYIKTKFARCMLGILKITQDNNKEAWRKVPLQDFTEKSDIDWSKSIKEIDQQLYKKYDLSKEEIDFIETRVKEMK